MAVAVLGGDKPRSFFALRHYVSSTNVAALCLAPFSTFYPTPYTLYLFFGVTADYP
jgi:hypothetical protein